MDLVTPGIDIMINLDPVIEDILKDAIAGKEIKRGQALELMDVIDREYHALCYVANELRSRSVGEIVTFVSNRNIYSTNICKSTCKFCSFRSNNGYIVEKSDILQRCSTPGITEICMQGGLNPELGLEYFEDLLGSIKERYSYLHIHAFSPAEVEHMSSVSGVSIKEALTRLRDAGLGSIPGTAAEILDDEVRSIICPDKINTKEWIKVIKTAHKLGIPSTSTIMYGHVESPENRVDHMLTIREIQKETGGFTEFIPLSFIPGNELGDKYGLSGANGTDDVKMIAVSRLVFNDLIPNIQTAWVKFGRKFAQTMLMCGANDLGGTLYQESISKASGGIHGEFMSKEDMGKMVESIDRKLRQRDTLYNLLDG